MMYRKRVFWIVATALVLAAGGGYAAYAYWLAPEEIVEEGSTLQTAAVTMGDLSITADGTGMLVASSDLSSAQPLALPRCASTPSPRAAS
jgi:hypothetical protein